MAVFACLHTTHTRTRARAHTLHAAGLFAPGCCGYLRDDYIAVVIEVEVELLQRSVDDVAHVGILWIRQHSPPISTHTHMRPHPPTTTGMRTYVSHVIAAALDVH